MATYYGLKNPTTGVLNSLGQKPHPKATHIYDTAKGEWEEFLHPRGNHGKFAKKPGGATPAPKVKGHGANYMPPVWSKIKGTNVLNDGNTLYSMKKSGAFKNDHEMYLAANKLATSYKKKHPNDKDAASANQIYNAALRYEIDVDGKHTMLPQVGGVTGTKAGGSKGVTAKAAEKPVFPMLSVSKPPAGYDVHEYSAQKGKWGVTFPNGKSDNVFGGLNSKQEAISYAWYHSGEQPPNIHSETAGGVKLTSKFKVPGKIYPIGKTMPGVSGAQVYEDNQGNKWLVKVPGGAKGTSQAYSNNAFLTDLDVATSRIQNAAGLPTPSISTVKLDNGKVASVHKMFSRVSDAFPNNKVDLATMSPEDIKEVQKSMIVDWLLSNHDPHTGNFLKTDKGIVSLDKGQSFKYFSKDKLTTNFGSDLNPPLAPNKPVYSTLMKQHIDGKGQLFSFVDDPDLQAEINRIENIDDDQYKDWLRPYAEKAAAQGLLGYPGKSPSDSKHDMIDEFLNAAVNRKNNIDNDFAELQLDLNTKAHKADAGKVEYGGPPKVSGGDWKNDFGPVAQKYTPKEAYYKGIINHDELVQYSTDLQPPKPKRIKTSGLQITDLKPGDELQVHGGDPGDQPFVVSSVDPGGGGLQPTVTGIDGGQEVTLDQDDLDSDPWYVSNGLASKVQIATTVSNLPNPKFADQEANWADAEIGDWVSLDGYDHKIVTKSSQNILLDNNMLIFPSDFESGNVFWGSTMDGSTGVDPVAAPKKQATKVAMKAKPKADKPFPNVAGKLAPGYSIVAHPTDAGKFSIQKPGGGGLSQSAGGITKGWDTPEDALNSSTMAKYKTNADQQYASAKAGMHSNISPYIGLDGLALQKKFPGITPDQAEEFLSTVNTLASGEDTPDDYVKFKQQLQIMGNAIKAAGAAEVIEDFDDGSHGFIPPTPAKGKGKNTPGGLAWKNKGGLPPAWSTIKGPEVKELGQQLYERKLKGEFDTVHEMYSAAGKLSNAQKKAAQKANPGKTLQSSVDYSSPNQIRNAAVRLEYEATGNVIFSSKVQLTSEVVAPATKAQNKTEISLHSHVPTVDNPVHHPHPSTYAQADLTSVWTDKTKPPGSYENPHSFGGYSSSMLSFGNKYTSGSGWNPSQLAAWKSFTSSSTEINTYFRTGGAGLTYNAESAKTKCNAMIDAFNSPQVKPLDDWTIATRGTGGGWEVGIGSDSVTFDQIKAMEGKVVRNKCPVSTSLDVTPAFSSQPIQITYKLPPGFRGIFALKKSNVAGEREMIAPPGMTYRILEVKQGSKIQVLVEVVSTKLPEKFT